MAERKGLKAKSRDRLAVAVLCGIAWLPVTFVRGGYAWDDWVAAVGSREELRGQARELGRVFPLTTEVFIAAGSIGVRIGTVLALILTGLAVLRLVERFGALHRSELVMISVLTAVNPLDTSKSMLSTAAYTWSLTFFFLGWALLVSRRWWVLALPLLFISYDTSSLLFFAVLPLVDLMFFGRTWRHRAVRVRIAGLSTTVVLFAVIRFFIRTPEGPYEGYNSVGLFGLTFMFASLVAVALLALGLLHGRPLREQLSSGGSLLAATGVVLTLVALIPYMADRNFPPYLSTETRHYLLVGLGLAVTVVGVARSLEAISGVSRLRAKVTWGTLGFVLIFVWFNGFLSLQHWSFADEVSQAVEAAEIPGGSLVLVSYEETPAIYLTRRLGPNYANSWYVWTSIVDRERDDSVLAVFEQQYPKYLEGRFSNAYGSQRDFWGVEGFEPSTTAIRLKVDSVGGFLGFFAAYEVSISEIQVDLPRG
jgi:hypothetical protein